MNRLPLFLLLLAAPPALAAQAGAPKQDPPSPFLGIWEGPYQSEAVPPGSLRLTVAREAGAWKVTLEIQADQPPAAGEVREFRTEADSASWVQDVNDMQCRSVAKLVAGVLKGEAECTQGGAVVVTATFLLEKKQ